MFYGRPKYPLQISFSPPARFKSKLNYPFCHLLSCQRGLAKGSDLQRAFTADEGTVALAD